MNSVKDDENSKKRKPLFDPKEYASQHQQLDIANNYLSQDELWRYAVIANEVRMKILQNAKDEDDALARAFD